MQHSGFVHLHLHTRYSLLDGAIRPGDLFALARTYRMPAVAMTDHGNLFGAVDFYEKAMKSGIKPIIGCEVYVAPGKRTDRGTGARGGCQEGAHHLILLVKNHKGYRNLCRLLTSAYLEGFYYRPRVDKELLSELNEGLIAMSACLHGEIPSLISTGQKEKAVEAAGWFKEVFSDKRFYLELQHNGMEEQEKVNEGIIELSKKLDIPLVATNDCHYLKKEESRIHDILLCIQTGKTVDAPNRMRFATDQFYFKSPEEMIEAFRHVPEAVSNTIEIAERCNLELGFGETHLPEFPIPAGETLDSFLDRKAMEGLERRLEVLEKRGEIKRADRWHYYERLKKELRVIKAMGFSGYFLIVADFIDYARRSSIPVGPGRGSAAGSLVAYSLGITNLDPIRYNLLFERFLNPDRVSLPDIDIDFCFEGRDSVIRYVTEKYGSENVTQIITFGQMKARAVIRDVGRVLNMPYAEVDRIAKLVPAQPNITIDSALELEPEFKKLADRDPKVRDLIEVAKALEGLPRHASTHAAGVVISNRPLVEYLPLYRGQKDDIVTTQFSMKDVEKLGLVKFDFLGLKTLTVIDRALKLVKEKRGVDIDIENLPLDDEPTYRLLSSGDTNGIFQLESSGIKDLLRKLKPGTFEDLMAAVALYRPGPLQSGMVEDFIKRKHRKVAIHYELPQLKDILENTYGVIVYQEQVMEIARVLAGFTPGDADMLRKAMGKKIQEEMLNQREKFLEGAGNKKIPRKKAERIFDLMAHFAGYGFNKSHSAAYALIAYQTAYLKAHFPIEFMAALLTSDMNDTDKVVKYIAECRSNDIEVLPPHVNESAMEFTVTDGGKIRFGLAAVKNVGRAAIEEILSVREDGPFTSLVDFLSRVDTRKVNKKVVESLIKCGAFDFMEKNRAALLSSLDRFMEAAQVMQRDRAMGQTTMFDFAGPASSDRALNIAAEASDEIEFSEKDLLAFEKETLGFYISHHPLSGLEQRLQSCTTDTTETVCNRENGQEVSIGCVVTGVNEKTTRKGDRMAFLRVEDLKGGMEVIVFPDLYRKIRAGEIIDRPLVITGRIDRDEAGVKVIASDITPLSEARRLRTRKTHIYTGTEGVGSELLKQLKALLADSPGSSPVFLHLMYPDGREVVLSLPEDIRIDPAPETIKRIKGLGEGIDVRFS